jgi:anti-anti-sigma factor
MSAAVVVKLPEALDAKYARKLGRELKSKMTGDSPFLVLDLSRVKNIDLSGLEGLLGCMDELAKRDGGLQLRGISAEAATLLDLTRVGQLMQRFAGFSADKAPEFEVSADSLPEEAQSESPVQLPVAA